jgi:protein-tyrosine phosphatase
MTRPVSVLTVCLGNICRSPTAAAALQEAATADGLPLEVRSAGTAGWHLGAPPDPRMRAAGAAVGLSIDGAAERVDQAALDDADLVLAMDRSNLADLERLAGSTGIDTPIVLFREFDPAAAGSLEVPDPYYGGPEGFEEVVAICRRTATNLVGLLADGGVDAALAARGSGRR